MGTYAGDFQRLRDTFVEFLHHLPFYGTAILCIEDAEVRKLLPQVTRQVLTYGTGEEADVRAIDIRHQQQLSHFGVVAKGHPEFKVSLNLPGLHNVMNALAAIAVALQMGVEIVHIQRALERFQGIGRRFQVYGDCRCGEHEFILVDDYGHHPRELEATMQAVRQGWPGRRLLLVFQPHRYTRTRDAFDDFVKVLSEADALVLTEVYAAGESPLPDADGRALTRAVRARGQNEPVFVNDLAELPRVLRGMLHQGDMVLLMGAGDIGRMAAELAGEWCA